MAKGEKKPVVFMAPCGERLTVTTEFDASGASKITAGCPAGYPAGTAYAQLATALCPACPKNLQAQGVTSAPAGGVAVYRQMPDGAQVPIGNAPLSMASIPLTVQPQSQPQPQSQSQPQQQLAPQQMQAVPQFAPAEQPTAAQAVATPAAVFGLPDPSSVLLPQQQFSSPYSSSSSRQQQQRQWQHS